MKTITPEDLRGFDGTSDYYRWSSVFPYAVLTDGTRFVAKAGAYWLMDAIASYHYSLRRIEEKNGIDTSYQFWRLAYNPLWADPTGDTLKLKGMAEKERFHLVCTDGNEKVLARQLIDYTDFPLDNFDGSFEILALWDGEHLFIMLPSEN